MKQYKIKSEKDGLILDLAVSYPENDIKGIICISHGMSEHKERYFHFMQFLSKQGYAVYIHDHRGHGASIKNKEDLGYFYSADPSDVTADLLQIITYAKSQNPNIPLYLFAHSMGTLIARLFLQEHDDIVEKVVLCGPPTRNKWVDFGIGLVKLNTVFYGNKHRSHFIDHMTFGSYKRKGEQKNSWLCSDSNVVANYQSDELCGYVFTNNGFLNLFRMVRRVFNKSLWKVSNADLPIFVIAGADDPVIQGKALFEDLLSFLKGLGYKQVISKLYPGLRHELLNEKGKEKIWNDILDFYEK